MDGRFSNPFMNEQEDPGNSSTNTSSSSPDHSNGSTSPSATTTTLSSSPFSNSSASSPMMLHNHDSKSMINIASSPHKKSSRRSIQKRVVSIPIAEVEGSRLKGEGAPPPSDSWAWRKYGQKPIKGSPYPRGYYRCSSSKGCPARKQVERSRVDPTMLVITYACEHNHPWPASRNSNSNATTTNNNNHPTTTTTNNKRSAAAANKSSPAEVVLQVQPAVFTNQAEIEPEEKYAELGDDCMISIDDFGWFADVASTSPTVLESPICSLGSRRTAANNDDHDDAADMAMIFPMREEDESLFADLGELPECAVVFRRGFFEQEEERRRCSLRAASWCGSTG